MEEHSAHPLPYDENLLERARTQWQFGDWQSLAQLNRDTLQHHPDRAKLALLAAAGRLQTGQDIEARQYIRLAQDWGVSKTLISQVLIAGVHNSLGRAAAIGGAQPRALQHFESVITIGSPGSERRLLTQALVNEQLTQIGFTNRDGPRVASKVVITDSITATRSDVALRDSSEKVIWFHAGTVKTGSTHIQYMLWKYRAVFAKHGVCYFDIDEPMLHRPRYANADFMIDSDRKRPDSIINEALNSIDAKNIVISDEALWSNIPLLGSDCFSGFKKKVVVYMRKPADIISSWAAEYAEPYNGYLTTSASGMGVVPINKGLPLLTGAYLGIFNRFFQAVKQLGDTDLIVRSYDRGHFMNGDILLDFLQTIDPVLTANDEILNTIHANQEKINPSRTRKFCDISAIIWDYACRNNIAENYTLELVEHVYSKCESGDDRPVIATLSDTCIEEICDVVHDVENMLYSNHPGTAALFDSDKPSIYMTPRYVYIPVDIDEAISLAEMYLRNDYKREIK